jgi:hypothetical protein
LTPNRLEYTGSKTLTQFTIERYSFHEAGNGSRAEVKLVLQRIYSYHVTNTFMPTVSLLVIVELTLFFGKSQTELALG